MLLVDLQVAGRNLTRHTLRNLLLGAALAMVTGAMVLLGALADGIEHAMFESATTLLTGHVNVGGFFKITAGSAAPLVSDWPKVLAATRAEVPEIDYVTVRGRGWSKAVSESASMDLVLGGVDMSREPGFRKVVIPIEGKLDDLMQPDTVLLFQGQAERLKVGVGDQLTISAPTERGVNNTADVRVAVVARNVGLLSTFQAFIQGDTLRRLYGLNDTTTGAIHLYLKKEGDAPRVAARLREKLAEKGWRVMEPDPQPYWMKLFQTVPSADWTGQKLDVTTWEDEMGQFKQFIFGFRALSNIVLLLVMAVVLVGILNTLAIAIRERTREIGTLRAIGMQRTKVLWLFLLETALLGLGGAAAGAALASAFAGLLNAAHILVPEGIQLFLMQEHLSFWLAPGAIAVRVAAVALLTVVASVFPALRAARLKPVTAMHHIG